MARVVILRGNAYVIGPYIGGPRLGAVDWPRLLADVRSRWSGRTPRHSQTPETVPARCSFCGKDRNQHRRLISGPNHLFICEACVDRCRSMLDGPRRPPAG